MVDAIDTSTAPPRACPYTNRDLRPYRRFPKLLGERKFASRYPEEPFPFLALPPELRLQVYHWALCSSEPIELWPETGSSPTDFRARKRTYRNDRSVQCRKQLGVSLLRVCKLVYCEASPFFYGENEFRFSGINGHIVAFAFTDHIGMRNLKCIKSLTVAIPFWSEDRSSMYNDDWNLNSIASMWRLRSSIPFDMPHNGGWYFDKAFDLLVRKLKKADKLHDFNMVMPDWFQHRGPISSQKNIKIWRSLDKLLAAKAKLKTGMIYMCDPEAGFEGMKDHQDPVVKKLMVRGIQKYELAFYDARGWWEGIFEPLDFDAYIMALSMEVVL